MAERYSVGALLVVSLAIALAGQSCDRTGRTKVPDIDYHQATMMMASDNPPVIIDVRTPGEFVGELGHIPGSRLMPLQSLQDSLAVLQSFRDMDILLVCRSGRRSRIAGELLVKEGFKNVYNISGGMIAWNRDGGPTE